MRSLGPRHKCLDLRPRLTVRGNRGGGERIIVKQFLSSKILRRWVIRIDAGGGFPRNRVACDAVIAVAMGAVPSKFSVFDLAAAARDITRVIVLVKASIGH